jgi:hypothetical protein
MFGKKTQKSQPINQELVLLSSVVTFVSCEEYESKDFVFNVALKLTATIHTS